MTNTPPSSSRPAVAAQRSISRLFARTPLKSSGGPGWFPFPGDRQGGGVTSTRLLSPDDAPALLEIAREDADFFAPWEPLHDEDWLTEAAQRQVIAEKLEQHRLGLAVPHVVLDNDGSVLGRMTLNNVVRGAFQSCSLGYFVRSAAGGRGHATAAVRRMLGIAFGELGLHRVEAGTLVHNVRSQRVLEKNGFERFGLAPQYLRIQGRWQDHVLFQLLNPDVP